MGLHHLLVAALAVTAVAAAPAPLPCACVNADQKINPITNPMIFIQQPTLGGVVNGDPCTMDCTFTASLDDGADSDSTLQIQVLTNSLVGDGRITVTGMDGDVTITPSSGTGLQTPKSYDTSITIKFTEGASDLGVFMLVVQKVKGRPAPPVVKTTSPAPVTAPYDPKFTHNPKLVASDIMLAFDLSSKDIEKYKKFARDIIKELAINPKSLDPKETEDCGAGSRLTLVGLSGISGFDNLYAPYWTSTYEQADGNINSFVQIANGNYFFSPIEEKYIYGFDIPKDAAAPPNDRKNAYTNCTNREKLLILLTSVAPNEYDPKAPNGGDRAIFTDFLGKGVHQILVYYDISDTDKKYYNETYASQDTSPTKSNAWNFFQINGGDKDIEGFFNTFLVDSDQQMTCQLKQNNDKKIEVLIKKDEENKPISIPPYYAAKTDDSASVWETAKHYCNFQETTVRLIKDSSLVKTDPTDPDAKTKMCLKVYYDLETGKDFVSIFSGNPDIPDLQEEVVRLTGRDVSGTTFELPDATGSIVFSSDEKTVYDGFYATLTKKTGATCP